MRLGIKARVLFSLVPLIAGMLAAFAYGGWQFRRLEARMNAMNNVYVPALKAANQMESSFFLLESDLDKSLMEGILRPVENLQSLILSRATFLSRITTAEDAGGSALSDRANQLKDSFMVCSQAINQVWSDWAGRASREGELSARRTDFRLKLKGFSRDVDREIHVLSEGIQQQLNTLVVLLSVMLGLGLIMLVGITAWVANSLRPLEGLAQIMRSISENGLDEMAIQRLSELPAPGDEIGTLSRESQKMAATLMDHNKLLREQKLNLERAHQSLAQQNDELRTAQAKLIQSEKLGVVGRMAAQMAHEIRNPLNALNLHVELLGDKLHDNREALDGMEPVRKEINRLITVTDSYLDLARAPKLVRSSTQLNELIEELHDLYAPVLKEKGIFFTCDLGDLPRVNVDRGQISQVLGNLLKNATESFEAKGGAVSRNYIRIISQADDGRREVTISVLDNGKGISADQRKNIFSPFSTSKAEGTGLGLTHSRQIVEAHGGEISFESTHQRGTKFTVKLPVSQLDLRRGELHGSL